MDYKEHVAKKIAEAACMDVDTVRGLLETPPEQKMGDLAFPCFTLAKQFRKAPAAIAVDLAAVIKADMMIAKVEANGPYLNFFFCRDGYMQGVVNEIQQKGEQYGQLDIGKGKTVIVEFSSPNIAKPFHIGHLFSTSVGNSLSKIYKNLGYTVERINHLGDWGTQFGKLISAYKRWGDKEVINKDPINELLKIYVRFHQEAETDPSLEEEARGYFKQLEDGQEDIVALWQYFRDISLKEFSKTYETLGVSFDSFNGEAFYSDKMDAVVQELKEKKLLTESENAQVVMLEDENLLPCMVLKSDGATIYATRDLAAAIYRQNTYHFYKNIYVVGLPQALHFKQIFAVLKKMGYQWAEDCVHVGFGTVKFPDRKLSTRNGDVVLLDEVLQEAITKTRAKVEESNLDIADKDEVAKKIGIGAVMYTFLKNSREKDIVFSWDDMLDFDGESAPYVQYSYARGKSVLRKAEGVDFSDADFAGCVSDEEYALAKQLAAFAAVTLDAADKNEPFYVTRYVTNLARTFNKFYNSFPILKAEEQVKKARLALTAASCQVIKGALALLGIDVVESM